MRIVKKFIFVIAAAVLLAGTRQACGAVVDKIAVVVNDEIITYGEIDRNLAKFYEEYSAKYSGQELIKHLEEARQRVLSQLIDEKVMYSEAKKLNVEVSDSEVEEKVDETAKRFGSRADFERTLMAQNMSLKDLKAKYREQLMIRRIIDLKVGSRITITPSDIDSYYNSHLSEFVQEPRVRLSNILIRSDEDPAKAAETAKDIYEKLKAGSDFAEMAKTYSEGPNAEDGGLMGYTKKGELMPEIENAIAGLKPGEFTPVIKTPLGYHIFKVEELSESTTVPLSEARRTIENILFKERINKKIKSWVEGLKKNAYIAFK